jgi:hypothetical protein
LTTGHAVAVISGGNLERLCSEWCQRVLECGEDREVALAGMDVQACAWYRRGEAAGVLERDGGVGVPVVDRRGHPDRREVETPGSGQHPQMLLWKLPWLAVLFTVLGASVALFGRVERRGLRRGTVPARRWMPSALVRPGLRAVATTVGYAACVLGLLGVAVAGPAEHGPLGLPITALALFLAGSAFLRVARSASDRQVG